MLCPLYECPSTIFNQYVVFLEESSASSVRALPVEIKCPHSAETESTGFCDAPSQIGAERGTSVCVPRCFQNLNADVQHNYWHKMVGFEKFHFLWVLWVFYGIYVRVSWERGNRAIRGRDICLLLNRLLLLLLLHSCFLFQSEASDKSSAESDSETEVEQVSGYYKLLATLKTSPESESEEEEDESESEEAEESEAEMDSEGSQETGEAEGGEEDKNDVPEEEEGSWSFPMLLW